MNADGTDRRQLTNDGSIKFNPAVTSDNRYIVYETSEGHDIWRINIDGGNPTRLTDDGRDATNPDLSPDGKWLVYSAIIEGEERLWRVSIEGGEPVKLTDFKATEPHISPDGKFISSFFTDEQSVFHLGILPFNGGSPVRVFDVDSQTNVNRGAIWLPDGRTLAYIVVSSGVGNLWLQPVGGGSPKQITDFKQKDVRRYAWTPDGKQVAFVREDVASDAVMITGF